MSYTINALGESSWIEIYSYLRNDSGGYVYDISFIEDFCETYSQQHGLELYLNKIMHYKSGNSRKGYKISLSTSDNPMVIGIELASALSDKFKHRRTVLVVNGKTYEVLNTKIK